MTTPFSASLSPLISGLPSLPHSPQDLHRPDITHGSRPCATPSGTRSSHVLRHHTASAGSTTRHLDCDQEYLLSSSKIHGFSPRNSIGDVSRHVPIVMIPQTPSPASKVRRCSAASLSCNEVPVFRASGRKAHQSDHAPNGCTPRATRFRFPQVPPVSVSNEPPSLSSSLTSATLSSITPPTPQSSVRHHKRSAFIPPPASLHSVPPCALAELRCERYTRSSSPLSHAPRELPPNSHRLPPRASPCTFSSKRGFVPLRARPTLAMSMQIHAPTPVMPIQPSSPPLPSGTRQRSRSRPDTLSRPSSPLTSSGPLPQRLPMPRPPSRSERLLRDTLRRAEEQERMNNPTPSLFGLSPPAPNANIPPSVAQMFGPCRLPAAAHGGRRHRRNTSSSMQSDSSCDYFEDDVLDEESPEDEEDNDWLWRANNAARVVSGARPDIVPYGTPVSPSPTRAQLQRSVKSSPSMPRRHSHSQSVPHVRTHSPSRGSIDEHSVTPHEAVLRSRLEGLLKNANVQDKRRPSVERREVDSGFGSGSGNSIASSRNLSGEGDFFFGASGDSSLTSHKSNDARYRLGPASPRREQRQLRSSTSPRLPYKQYPKSGYSGSTSPLTPPPSPPFNAHIAAAQCKAMDGYISFANIEGLGVPDGSDEEADEDAKSRSRWFQWLHISGKAAPGDRARPRSDSCSSASR